MELLFERFLSEERGEWPDIDLDLPSGDKREQAIQYVYERYGKLGAAMTANCHHLSRALGGARSGKALDFDEETLGRSPDSSIRGNGKIQTIQQSASFAMRVWICASHESKFFQLYQLVRICRVTWASIQAAW